MKINSFKIWAIAWVLTTLLIFQNCNEQQLSGEELAKINCSRCHQFPSPDLLPKDVWAKGVLPVMSGYLGDTQGRDKLTFGLSAEEYIRVAKARVFPETPVITTADWELICQYYSQNAPDTLVNSTQTPIKMNLSETYKMQSVSISASPDVCMLKYDAKNNALWCGLTNGMVGKLDSGFQLNKVFGFSSPVVDLSFLGNEMLAVEIGKMNPGDVFTGRISQLSLNQFQQTGYVLDSLNRPVQLQLSDLNNDGVQDYIVCNYGHYIGNLVWWEGKKGGGGAGKFHEIRNTPGARTVIPFDYNKDGKMDLIALFAQGNESIILYKNIGNGEFEEQYLLRFPPVFGSSFIEIADMNNDNLPDIIYANGDNADYSKVLKPYHGIRVFLNDGQWNFTEKWFFQMNGGAKTAIRDFDGDGDLDIAAISFFPDNEKRPEEAFVYLENMGGLNFLARADKNSTKGRWMVMTTADLDKNGKEEIILGSALPLKGKNAVQLMVIEHK